MARPCDRRPPRGRSRRLRWPPERGRRDQGPQGLPASVAPGLYTVRFRQVAVSDEILVVDGVERPAQEWTMGTCAIELDLRPAIQATAQISVLFAGADCVVTVEMAVATP